MKEMQVEQDDFDILSKVADSQHLLALGRAALLDCYAQEHISARKCSCLGEAGLAYT